MRNDAADLLAKAMWDRWATHGGTPDHFMFLRVRVREFLEHYDEDCVYVACLALVDERGASFDPVRHLSAGSFAWVVDGLGVPRGAWGYQRWLTDEPREDVRISLVYWLDMWEDGILADNAAWVAKARANLAILERNYYPLRANVLRVEECEVLDLCRR